MSDYVVEAKGLNKDYRTGTVRTPVLRNIDLQVPRGECLFLVGPSGSGKTTLLSILGCVLTPDSGQLRILRQDVTRLSAKEQARFRRERIGFVFQRFHLFDGLRAWENVALVFDLLGHSRTERKRRSMELLDVLGLGDRLNHRVSQLSMGQRQRVAVARALAADPDVILADEPTASLDAQSGRLAIKLLKQLSQRLGKTVIVVTHDARIFSVADRILRLVDGQIVAPTPPRAEHRDHRAGGRLPLAASSRDDFLGPAGSGPSSRIPGSAGPDDDPARQ
jgi:putative ABC transport system ATP-binding protein